MQTIKGLPACPVETTLSLIGSKWAVLILRELHQRTYDEIAEICSLDLGTVKSRISRGRKRLRKILLESGNFSAAAASKETGKEGCT